MKPAPKKIPSPFIPTIDVKKIARHGDSLRDRLQAMSQEVERQKAEDAARRENERLQPFRDTIKKLTQVRQDLLAIIHTIAPNQGITMQEILDEVREQQKNHEQVIADLIQENAEALELVGITSLADLVNHRDFVETPEVITYYAILKKLDDIAKKNEYLADRLADFGIVLAHFSYAEAVAKIKEKIQSIDIELIEEKQKTPEGLQEISETIQSIFHTQMPKISLVENTDLTRDLYPYKIVCLHPDGETKILIGVEQDQVSFSLGHQDLDSVVSFIPADFKKVAYRFSDEIADSALIATLQKKSYALANEISRPDYKESVTEKIYALFQKIIAFQNSKELLVKKSMEYSPLASVLYYDQLVKRIEDKKAEVATLKRHIEIVERETDPTAILFLQGDSILFPHQKHEYESIRSHKESKERDLRVLENKITYQKNNPPWINKERWQFEIDQMELQKQGITQEIDELEQKERQVFNGNRMYFPLEKYPALKDFLQKQEKQEGTFIDIRNYLYTILDSYSTGESVPSDLESVAQTYKQFKNELELFVK
jgi:hypothetical protein